MNRRQFIAGCGIAAVTATAGCVDSIPGFGDDIDTSSPEAVVESFIDLQERMYEEPDDTEEDIDAILHSEAPQQEEEIGDLDDDFFENIEYEVTDVDGINEVTRDVSADQIRSIARDEFSGEVRLDDATIDQLADAEMALVDAVYTTKTAFEMNGETETTETDNQFRYLVGLEDDEWQIVIQEPMLDE